MQRSHSFKWASFVKPSKSPTKAVAEVDSPQPSPQRMEHNIGNGSRQTDSTYTDKSRTSAATLVGSEASTSQHTSYTNSNTLQPNPIPARPQRQDSQDNLKSFKVSLDDPAWKVLPAALKKYKINNDDWQNYAMFICYGAPGALPSQRCYFVLVLGIYVTSCAGNRIERCLSYDEKPLLLFQKLKDAKKNPVFMLKHIKDIRSPIAVAQQKQAARKASASAEGTPPAKSNSPPGANNLQTSPGQTRGRPPKLQVSHLPHQASGLLTGVPNGQSGWPELMSPLVESKGDGAADASKSQGEPATGTSEGAEGGTPPVLREMPPATEVSYSVAIYPYMAEQEDEFDVVVCVIRLMWGIGRELTLAQWRYFHHRLPSTRLVGGPARPCRDGAGGPRSIEARMGTRRVPARNEDPRSVSDCGGDSNFARYADCLATRNTTRNDTDPSSQHSVYKFPWDRAHGLQEERRRGVGFAERRFLAGVQAVQPLVIRELHLRLVPAHLVLSIVAQAVKEETGDRGWVPSWFIGKVPTSASGNTPATPSASTGPGLTADAPDASYTLAGTQAAQVSPMSSAFPPIQSRTAAVIQG